MKMFLWHNIKHATNNYHPEGGVVIFAESVERAKELTKDREVKIADDEVPDLITNTDHKVEEVYVFADSGCC